MEPRALAAGVFAFLLSVCRAHAADVFVGVPPFNPDPGEQFSIDITVDVGSDVLGSYFFQFEYDPTVVHVISIGGGTTVQFSSAPTTNAATFDSGLTPLAASQPSMVAPTGSVSVATITLEAVLSAEPAASSLLDLNVISLFDGKTNPLVATVFPSSVLINFDPNADPDNDGLTNQEELAAGTGFNDPDSDDDTLPDGFEVHNGLNPLDDGTVDPNNGPGGDPDDDGHTNLEEFEAGSDPQDSRSFPVAVDLHLVPGFMPVFFPLDLPAGFSAFDLLPALAGGSNAVTAITAVDGSGSVLTATRSMGGTLSGDDFPLVPGQGVLADVAVAATRSFQGPVQCPAMDLVAGVNVVGLRCIPSAYTASQMLLDIGAQSVVSMIQRYDTGKGRFETAAYADGVPSGTNFTIQEGEAYLVHMKIDRPGYDPLE